MASESYDVNPMHTGVVSGTVASGVIVSSHGIHEPNNNSVEKVVPPLTISVIPAPPSTPKSTIQQTTKAEESREGPPSAGKRGASGPLVSTSDEDSSPDSPRESPRGKSLSPPCLGDHDYENVSSPGNSSTASGPTYVRQPGFTHHAHEVSRPRVKKKKTAVITVKEGLPRDPTPPKAKPKRGKRR